MRPVFRRTLPLVALVLLSTTLPASLVAEEAPEVTHDGLHRVPDSKVGFAYQKPEADFTPNKKAMILDVYVAFRANWLRDQNRSSVHRVTHSDMERMKSDVADLLREVFVERLEADDGFPVVEEPGEDVLLLRPAIIDLDVTAPDTSRSSRSRTFTAEAGAATLFLELFDSVSGEILARVIDRQVSRETGGFMTWSNRVSNRAAAQRVMRGWADLLRSGLDEVHGR